MHVQFLFLSCSWNVQKAADVWKKDVWDFQALSQTFFVLRFPLGNEGKDGKHPNSETWPGSPRRPSPKHPRPPEIYDWRLWDYTFHKTCWRSNGQVLMGPSSLERGWTGFDDARRVGQG